MIGLLIAVVIWGLIFYVIWWAVGALGIPEPFNKVIRVVIILAAVLVAINLLTRAAGVLGAPIDLGLGRLG